MVTTQEAGEASGLYSVVELTPDPQTGKMITPARRMHDLLEEIELAAQVGLDVFGAADHHRPDYLASAPRPHPSCGGKMRGGQVLRAT